MVKKVIFVIASEGFQPIEYGDAKKVLERAGLVVVTVSDQMGTAVAKDGSTTAVDLLIKEAELADYNGLFFIGGPGALEHLNNEESYNLLREWQKTNKPYGAICISPRILAKAGVLKNKKATGWDNDGELAGILSAHGAEYVREPVVVDAKRSGAPSDDGGNVVTANGPSAAREWGEAIVKILEI